MKTLSLITKEIDDDEVLFILSYKGKAQYPVTIKNIVGFEDFCYRLGITFTNTEKQIRFLRKNGQWSLAEGCVICQVKQYQKERQIPYFALGWFNVLPTDVLKKIEDEQCVPIILPYEDTRKELLKTNNYKPDELVFYQQLYGSDGILPFCLSAIPVLLKSVKKNDVCQKHTIYVNLLNFNNLNNFFDYTSHLYGKKRMIRNAVDLFDAMCTQQVSWKIDPVQQIIYLPCIPSMPRQGQKHAIFHLNPFDLPINLRDGAEKIKNVAELIKLCNHENIKKKFIESVFPNICNMSAINWNAVEKILLSRLEHYGKTAIELGIGKIHHFQDKLFCIMPHAVC